MDKDKIQKLLEGVREGSVDVSDAIESLRTLPFEDLGFAMVDNHRAIRQGQAEVVFCQGKTTDQIIQIVDRITANNKTAIATRAGEEVYRSLKDRRDDVVYHGLAKVLVVGVQVDILHEGTVLVVTAGTSDIPVAEEAAITAGSMGSRVERLYDVGVAGIHRLFGNVDRVFSASVIIVVAGMEGALPSIIGGLVDRPVIAVPTSVGYGASFGGLSALLTMLNTCAPGVLTVNIDNGFGAGYAAAMINRNTKE